MMFGFDESIELKRAPIQDVKKCLKDMIALIDSTKKYDKVFCDKIENIYYHAEKYYKELTPTEQANMDMWFSSIQGHFDNLRNYLAIGTIMSQMINTTINGIRTCCVNVISSKSTLF